MSNSPSASHEYLKNAVLTATPEQLQLMLYDGAIRFALRGLEGIRARDHEAAFNALERAQRIVIELTNGIRREVNPELADQMAALYSFVFRRLVDANIQQDAVAVEEAVSILRHMRETWVLLVEKLQQEIAQATASTAPQTAADTSENPSSSFVAEG
jgi:flagellar secretion chaperone FliS